MTPPYKCPKCEAGQAESDWTAAYQCGTLLGSTGTFHHTQGCRAFAELRKPLDAERDQLAMEVDTLRTANDALVDQVKRLEAVGDEMAAWLRNPRNLGDDPFMADQWEAAKGQP